MTLRQITHELALTALCIAYPVLVVAGIVAMIGLVPAIYRLVHMQVF